MPTVPKSIKCNHLGCKGNRSKLNSYCIEHGGINTTTSQAKYEKMAEYQSSYWRSLRKIQLSRNPLCQSCLIHGRVTQAKHIDHVFPWSLIGSHAFKRNLFQSLCPECHSHKTGLEYKGIIEFYSDVVVRYSLSDYERVVGGFS